MKVKVGDKIRHYLFGGDVLTGKVEEIQICHQGEKSGRQGKERQRVRIQDLYCTWQSQDYNRGDKSCVRQRYFKSARR